MELYDTDTEEKGVEPIKYFRTGPLLSTGVAPMLFHPEVIVTPFKRGKGDGLDEAGGGQEPSLPAWLDKGLLLPS